jgi:penicillin-binding protein 1A
MKPFLYCQAIEEAGFTPETPVPDQAQFFPGFGKVPAENLTSGRTMPLKDGIAYSKNGVAAYLMKQISPRRFSEFVKTANIQNEVKPYPSMALGACDLSLYEMMWGYTMFPGRGFSAKPLYITKIEDRNGNVLQAFVPEHKEVISELTAYTMARMMQGCVDYGTGKAMRGYGIKAEMGAKTGTTNDNGDAWFMGYTPQLLAGCWVGCEYKFIRFENTAVGQGGYAAMPIWAYFFKKLYEDKSLGYTQEIKFEKPAIDENSIIADYFNNSGGGGGGHRTQGQLNDENSNGEAGDYAAPITDEGNSYEPDQQLTPEEQKIRDDANKQNPTTTTTTSSNPAITPNNTTTNPVKKDTAKATMAPPKKEEKKDPKKEEKKKEEKKPGGGTDYKRK